MGLLKFAAKTVGSAALGATGVASTFLRAVAYSVGADGIADVVGSIQDKSFDTIRDMWTPDDQKTEAYYEAQAMRSEQRAINAAQTGESKRREYERMKEQASKKK